VASAAPVGPAKVKEAEPDQVPSAITEPERNGVGLDQVWDEMRCKREQSESEEGTGSRKGS
jgi:hypothetical protein